MYSQNSVSDTSSSQPVKTPEQIQAYNDSIAAWRTYMKSKAYNDSLDQVRKARVDSIRAHQDSVKQENMRQRDSMRQAFEENKRRQAEYVDSIKREKQKTIDSLNEIKKYRTSKAYKDSVAYEKQQQIDSMKMARQLYMDSVKAGRQRQLDSMKLVQQQRNDSLQSAIQARNDSMQAYIDSLKLTQQQFKDSLEQVKEQRVDSLARLKEQRQDDLYEKDKQRQKERRDRNLEKIQQERDAYTNEVFLKKRWGLRRKIVQNTFTRYNYFYNAQNKIREAEKNMYVSRVDNFDSVMTLYPYDPASDAGIFSNDMDSLAKRLSIGIQIHDPRSKWQDDLYLLLGKSFYYKGDFENAAIAFEYVMNYDKKYDIQKKKKKDKSKKDKKTPSSSVLELDEDKKGLQGLFQHKLAKNEAVIWLARAYIKQKEYDKAQILLDMINIDPKSDDEIRAHMYESYAHLFLEKDDKLSALPYLDSVSFDTHLDKRLRHRAAYIGGQLYAAQGDWGNAERLFTKVTEMNAPVEMDLNAHLNKVVAQTYSGQDKFPQIIRQLNRMTKEDKYKLYNDKIYMALAQTYNRAGETENAVPAYNKAIEQAVNSPVTKGMAFYELGELYYKEKDYLLAQSSFDSASQYLQSGGRPEYLERAGELARNLQAIAVPAGQIQLIDSMLALTQLSDREKRDWARREVRKHEERMRAPLGGGAAPGSSAGGGGWYFQNAEQKQKGSSEFKQVWGDRPHVDNWRRSNAIRFAGDAGAAEGEDGSTAGEKIDENYFLAQIPTSPAAIDSLNTQLEKSYIELEKTFYRTEEYAGVKELYEPFVSRFPKSQSLDLFYHDLFFIYLREFRQDSADYYKQKLAREFPQSEYNKLISELNTAAGQNTNFVDYTGIEEHMDETYKMLHAQMFTDVIVRTDEAKREYPVQIARYQSQYNLMKAVAYAGLTEYSTADSLLNEFIAVTQNDTLKAHARDVLNYIQKVREAGQEDTATSISSSVSFLDPTLMNTAYIDNKAEKHYVLIYVEKYDNRIMPVRAGIMDYNLMKKSDLNLKSTFSELKANERLIVIRELTNDAAAKKYMNDLKQQKELFKDYKMNAEMRMVTISESNFIILLNKKDFGDYLSFWNKNY